MVENGGERKGEEGWRGGPLALYDPQRRAQSAPAPARSGQCVGWSMCVGPDSAHPPTISVD